MGVHARRRRPPRRRLVRHRGQPRRPRHVGRPRRSGGLHRASSRSSCATSSTSSISVSTACATSRARCTSSRSRSPVHRRSTRRFARSMPTGHQPALRAQQLHRTRTGAGRRRRGGSPNRAWCRSWESVASARPASRSRWARNCSPDHPDGVWLCELAPVLDPDDLLDAIAAALRYTPPPGRPGRSSGSAAALRAQARAAGPRQLRAPRGCRRRVRQRGDDARRRGVGARDEPRGARRAGRAHLPAGVVVGAVGRRRPMRCSHPKPVRSSRHGHGNRAATSSSTSGTRSRSRRCVPGSTGSRSRSSSPPRRPSMMTPAEIERRLDQQFTARRSAAGAARWNATRRCARRSTGRTTCSRRAPAACSTDLGVRRWVRPRRRDARSRRASTRNTATASTSSASSSPSRWSSGYEVNGVTRYRLLEMIRQYAADQLSGSGDVDAARDLHAAHYLARTVELVAEARTDAEYEALETLGLETPNIAAGLRVAGRPTAGRRRAGDASASSRSSTTSRSRASRWRSSAPSPRRSSRTRVRSASTGSPRRACSPASDCSSRATSSDTSESPTSHDRPRRPGSHRRVPSAIP